MKTNLLKEIARISEEIGLTFYYGMSGFRVIKAFLAAILLVASSLVSPSTNALGNNNGMLRAANPSHLDVNPEAAFQDGCSEVLSARRGGKYDCDGFLQVKARNICTSKIGIRICIESLESSGKKNYDCGLIYVPAGGTATYYTCNSTGKYNTETVNDNSSSGTNQLMQIQLMAAPGQPGHVFFCMSQPMNTGVKEECFGFYPKQYFYAFGGPGIVWNEFRKDPARFSKVTVSIKKPIDERQRQQVVRLVEDWDSKHYNLTSQSCIDFVNSVVKVLGWNTPGRTLSQLPDEYLKQLARLNR